MYITSETLQTLLFIFTYFGLAISLVYLILVLVKIVLKNKIKINFTSIHLIYLFLVACGAGFAMFLQYQVWLSNEFTVYLTTLPIKDNTPLPGLLILFKSLLLNSHGYFLHYSLIHFWMSIFWGIISSVILLVILLFTKKIKPYLINSDEINLIFASSLIAGWPNMILFVIAMFSVFVIHSLFNYFKGKKRTIIFPSIVTALIIFVIYQGFFGDSSQYLQQLKFIIK